MTDTEILTSLCQSLDISVNELLSGEKLPVETYPQRAEENMMNLLKENEDNRKNSTIQLVVGIALGILTFILFLFITFYSFFHSLLCFIYLPSLLLIILIFSSFFLFSFLIFKK